jgi:hypothetical protein
VNIVLAASMSLACDKGAAITGLPFAAGDCSADVTVTNIGTQAEFSGGYVDGTRIYLPKIEVGTDRIVITATYFAA